MNYAFIISFIDEYFLMRKTRLIGFGIGQGCTGEAKNSCFNIQSQ